jgi:hypothetical protein
MSCRAALFARAKCLKTLTRCLPHRQLWANRTKTGVCLTKRRTRRVKQHVNFNRYCNRYGTDCLALIVRFICSEAHSQNEVKSKCDVHSQINIEHDAGLPRFVVLHAVLVVRSSADSIDINQVEKEGRETESKHD